MPGTLSPPPPPRKWHSSGPGYEDLEVDVADLNTAIEDAKEGISALKSDIDALEKSIKKDGDEVLRRVARNSTELRPSEK